MACVAYLPSSRSLLLRLEECVTYESRAPRSRAPSEVGNTVLAQTACAPAAYLRTYLAECPLTAFGARGWSVRTGRLAVAAGCQLERPQWVVSGHLLKRVRWLLLAGTGLSAPCCLNGFPANRSADPRMSAYGRLLVSAREDYSAKHS